MHTTIGTELRLLSIFISVGINFQVWVASLFDEQIAHTKLISWLNELGIREGARVCVVRAGDISQFYVATEYPKAKLRWKNEPRAGWTPHTHAHTYSLRKRKAQKYIKKWLYEHASTTTNKKKARKKGKKLEWS